MKIFGESQLFDATESQLAQMRKEVESESQNRLLNMNEAEYVAFLFGKFHIEPLEIGIDDAYVTHREQEVPTRRSRSDGDDGASTRRQVITYHVSFTGDPDLFKFAPSSRIIWTTEIEIDGDSISFEIVNWEGDVARIKHEAHDTLDSIRKQNESVEKEVRQFNENLRKKIEEVVASRKQQCLKQHDVLKGLGVPVKKSANTPSTFAVPVVKKKALVKPTAPNSAHRPEPTLDDSAYLEILRVCRHTGIEMERHPSIYADKDEETLRDHFIMVLSPHFDSVTGETFNKKGKTDILIRHEHSNVFVAECKFWSGAMGFHATIDQALGYLTWRDSKAAILVFVRNKELGPVLDQIESSTAEHSCYVSARTKFDEGSYNFNFRLPDDATRGVQLAIQFFHFPQA